MNRWRRIKYTDDGCNLYQCLHCKDTWETRTPADVWSYCPNCGIRWLGEHACRPAECPRWFWDRYGDRPDYDLMVQLTTGPVRADSIRWAGHYTPPTHKWLIERRYKWNRESTWSKWDIDYSCEKRQLSEAKWAFGVLQRMRAGRVGFGFTKSEWRVRLVPIK